MGLFSLGYIDIIKILLHNIFMSPDEDNPFRYLEVEEEPSKERKGMSNTVKVLIAFAVYKVLVDLWNRLNP